MYGRENASQVNLSGVEFRYTGVGGNNGKSSISFKYSNAANSKVEYCGIHSSFSRFVSIHSTNSISINNNIAYSVPGHNIYLEDGIESGNNIQRNLLINPQSAYDMK